MFIYKTDAQLEAMTAAERDTYATEKRTHEAKEAKSAIDEAVKTAKSEIETAHKTANDEANKEISALKLTLEEQGKTLANQSRSIEAGKKENLEDLFKAKYDEAVSGENHTVKEGFSIDTAKAIVSTDVMSVSAVSAGDFPTAGTPGMSAGLISMFGKVAGYFGYRNPTSRILDLVDVSPMDSAMLIVINETVTGTAEVTTECKLKPIVKMDFSTQEKSAEPVAAMWFTTTKLRRFFPALVNRMLQKFTELVNDKIPAVVLAAIKAEATAFTANAALSINANPNNYDALGAVIATIENLGLLPNAIVLNPIAWRNMKQEKTADGIYTMSNGQSISILQNGLDWGGIYIPIIKDPLMGVDEFIVGDLFNTVKVGVDTMLTYMETDGRTDAQATTAVTGLARNIRTHVIEKFVSVIIPTGSKVGIIKDTFANVKTLITAA